jgi:hypothetical protein
LLGFLKKIARTPHFLLSEPSKFARVIANQGGAP